MAQMLAELPPLAVLLTAYAPASERPWHRLCWLLDQRLADVVRRGGEPTIAAIRLAWWDAVLVEGDRAKGGGEPLVEAWRGAAPARAAPLAGDLIDGWRTLLGAQALSAEDLSAFARKRGGGLFGLIAGEQAADHGAALAQAGALWALWDLAGHSSDAALAQAAMAQARAMAQGLRAIPRGRGMKPLRLLLGMALADVRKGRVPAGGFSARHYRSLLWRSLLP